MTETIAIIGQGRLGTALSAALRAASYSVAGPLGREPDIARLTGARAVVLCVPDGQIAATAATMPAGPLLAHASGALTLAALGGREGFSMHPLLSVTRATTSFAGAGCAVDASSARARQTCLELASALGMRTFHVDDALRPLYHAAASVAAGGVVTVAALAEGLMHLAGVDREHLPPLVRSAIANWANAGGPGETLTGPVARGDEATVTMHREAIARHAPGSLAIWEALTAATRVLAERASTRPGHHI